ncbi:hypothetical protein MNBD_GAMMA22-2763 [hydrothermal vent metagenome]|uniref:Uncharacterized protein n=1 Tax=hydrothermal vent metagenome TaxID=652676 RepID=A0A3B1ACL8_9ZZZZ
MLAVSACANLIGSVSGGFYSSVNNEFKVRTPTIPKLSVQDGILKERVFVDFYQSRGFWKKHGLYSIEWYRPKHEIKSDKMFYSYNKSFTASFVQSNFGGRGSFDVIDARELKVNGRVAYQFVANGMLDNVDAVWVGTSIKFEQYIALISVVIHSETANKTELHGATVQTKIPWNKYNSFLNSFTQIK